MQHISIGTANGKPVGLDLDVLLSTRLLVQASSGAGKSWTLRRIIEQAFGTVQIIVIDPEGEFATLREKHDFVLVGKGGDVPASVKSAELLAHKLLELRASAVCDIFELHPYERHEWVKTFLDALIDAPKNLWHPVLVIVDEAHEYCPEKSKSVAMNSMVSLATRGRKRGFCAVWATQRLAKLNKDAAAELTNVLIGRTWLDVDRERAAEALGIGRKNNQEFQESIRVLKNGEFYALGRAVSTEIIKVQVGNVKTAHEKVEGTGTVAPPPTDRVKAMLAKLAEIPVEAEKKAKTIEDLQAENRSLRGQLAQRPVPEVKIPPVPVWPDQRKEVDELRRAIVRMKSIVTKNVMELEEVSSSFKQCSNLPEVPMTTTTLPTLLSDTKIQIHQGNAPFLPIDLGDSVERFMKTVGVTQNKPPVRTGAKLRAGAERMLQSLVTWFPEGMLEGTMRAHAGMKKSGTFSTYMSDLRQAGYIHQGNGLLYATQAGVDYFGGNVPQAPTTTEEVLAVWTPKLREGARRILGVLVDLGGRSIPLDDLANRSGMSKSGTFSTYLSDLRTARLIQTAAGQAKANEDTLFL